MTEHDDVNACLDSEDEDHYFLMPPDELSVECPVCKAQLEAVSICPTLEHPTVYVIPCGHQANITTILKGHP